MELASAQPDPICAVLRAILGGLRAVLGEWGLEAEVALLLHRRIGVVLGRIERMMIRFRAGGLWRHQDRKARVGAIRGRANCTLPRRFGWLVRAGGYRAAGFGSQLQALVQTPEMAELLAAAPQAGRLLRPLCRALAVELPGEPEKTGRMETAPVRRRLPRAKPEPFRIPLPRGVLSAVRRAGLGKLN
jgi:hypothetical protein